jgi:hypothetical protein
MKKLISILMLAACSCSAQFAFTNVFLGVTNNDGTGDNLRLAFQKTTTNTYFVTNLLARMDFGTGTTEADGTVTNSFRWTYSNAPVVIAIQTGNFSTTNAIASTTTTNFIYRATKAAVTFNWFAVERIP